jgi:hypothetical protein
MLLSWAAAGIAVVVTSGCGSESPMAPSAGGVVVQGVVLGDGASVTAAADTQPATSQAKKVTVRVDGTTLTVDVSANGTFQLKGVPSGTFTLVFLADGVEVGRVVVSAGEGSEVKIVVQVTAGTLVVVEIKVDSTTPGTTPATSSCVVNGGTVGQGIELEGDVSFGTSGAFKMTVNGRSSVPVDVVTSSSTSFKCVGSAKTTGDCKASVKERAKVHVRGTLTSCSTSAALVSATEVMVQKD